MTEFCHIVPIAHLDLVRGIPGYSNGQKCHLTLAHLIEENSQYKDFYANRNTIRADSSRCSGDVIMDNSAFEMYKRNEPMYPTEKLIDMANKVNADYVVMSDYPGEPIQKTMDAALNMIPTLKDNGYRTFFCPQSEKGDLEGLIAAYGWAFHHPDIHYVAFSILNIPIAMECETGNPLQKYLSRFHFMNLLNQRFDLEGIHKRKKFHFLGMTEGPNEISLMKNYLHLIDTWDSSAAVWAGLNGIRFDTSPTGLINGKYEEEVDFNYASSDTNKIEIAQYNMKYINRLLKW